MSELDGKNLRRSERYRLRLPVAYDLGGETQYSSSRDISDGGIFVETTQPLPMHVHVPLQVWLGSRHRDGVDVVRMPAQVVHHGSGNGMGLRFMHRSAAA